MSQRLATSKQSGVASLVAAIVGLGLLVALAFSLNALFASRSQQAPQATNQPGTLEEALPTTVAQQLSPNPVAARVPSTPPTTDQINLTKDWKVYTNAVHKYSIKYPPSLVYAVSSKGEGQVVFDTSLEDAKRPEGLEGKVIVITVLEGEEDPLIDRGQQTGLPVSIDEERDVSIGGYKGEQVLFSSPTIVLQTAVARGGNTYYFNLHDLEFRDEYDLMLSILQFLD